MRFSFIIGLAIFTHFNAFSVYFYCVATDGTGANFVPQPQLYGNKPAHPYNFEGTYISENSVIKIGKIYTPYTINTHDITGNAFKAWFGLGTPYAYFLYLTDHKTATQTQLDDTANAIKEQCLSVFKATGLFQGKVFNEVRVSDSFFSGGAIIKSGYPLVMLNVNPVQGQQNIFRVKQ